MERQQMIEQIAKYQMENGYYDTQRMRQEIAGMSKSSSFFDDFFGSTDVGVKTADIYPEIELAEELNFEREAADIEAENAEVAEVTERFLTGDTTNRENRMLEQHGIVVALYEDPESERPTGWRLADYRDRNGNPYSDQAGIDS